MTAKELQAGRRNVLLPPDVVEALVEASFSSCSESLDSHLPNIVVLPPTVNRPVALDTIMEEGLCNARTVNENN
ncbi:hypothetical protein EW146_g808 [Bondarzewia mesenterica]|uniref:Uncharacterized protein n=1 Tax=Bondarzewia mesenterica TaxID=1095465 RepID=A0A4S4MC36_9AGAM|nr:hypothetical protein EW146_g808 [Bondarzewia mesenterica]